MTIVDVFCQFFVVVKASRISILFKEIIKPLSFIYSLYLNIFGMERECDP